MKLTVVGYWGGFPMANGATSCYVVEKDGFVLVIDLGSGALSNIQKYYHVLDINALILSHYHHDHVADVGVLQFARLIHSFVGEEKKVLPIYGHKEDEKGFASLTHDYTKGIEYDPMGEPLKIGPFTITFLKTVHSVPCYGMRITDGECVIVYTADTAYQEVWAEFAKDADLLITDCNFYAGQDASKAGHMTSSEGATIAEMANVSEMILSHLPQFGDHSRLIDEASQHFKGKIRLAYEGLVWKK